MCEHPRISHDGPMSTPDYAQTPPPQPLTPMVKFFAWIRRLGLARPSDRILGGVAAAAARRLGIDPWLMRLILVILVFFFGLSVWVYVVAWICLPDERTGRIPLEDWIRPRH